MKNSLVAILLLVTIILLSYVLYKEEIIGSSFIISLPAAFVVIGYFIIHQLELNRKQKEKKRDIVLELIRGCRFFLNEQDILKDREKRNNMRDTFQDTYLQFSLVISEEG